MVRPRVLAAVLAVIGGGVLIERAFGRMVDRRVKDGVGLDYVVEGGRSTVAVAVQENRYPIDLSTVERLSAGAVSRSGRAAGGNCER